MKVIQYIGRMLVLSLILTVVLNLLLFGTRRIPWDILTEGTWRFEVGGAVVVIPWLLMAAVSLLLTLLGVIFQRRN